MSLFITKDLHWGKHIEEICDKSYWTLGLLKRNLSSCPMEVKLQAYKGLIWPVLEYASTAWDPHQSYLQEKLKKVQKKAVNLLHQTTTMNQAVWQLYLTHSPLQTHMCVSWYFVYFPDDAYLRHNPPCWISRVTQISVILIGSAFY